MSDNLSSLFAGLPKGDVSKEGGVYVETSKKGKRYFPAVHYENGKAITFSSSAAAEKANALPEDQARILAGSDRSGAPPETKSALETNLPKAETSVIPTPTQPEKTIPREKPLWVTKAEKYERTPFIFDEVTRKWRPENAVQK